jgi:hypothetical protein
MWMAEICHHKKAITKSSVGQYGPPTNAKVGSGVAKEYRKHPLLTSHTRRAPLVEIRYTGLPVVKASKVSLGPSTKK